MSKQIDREGVIKFCLDFTDSASTSHTNLKDLESWRQILFRLNLIGQVPSKYEGLAFGNVSMRTTGLQFLISGTQTGGMARLQSRHYCLVLGFDLRRNHIRAAGPIQPSSESLTHAAIYMADPSVQVALHVHSFEIWNAAQLGKCPWPITSPSHRYGTPEMAQAIYETASTYPGLPICMGGHQDGVMTYGETVDQAGYRLLGALAAALSTVE